jgi:group I intron endonuclease
LEQENTMTSLVPVSRNSGIYEILCVPTGEKYIGRTKNFSSRRAGHRDLLDKGEHHSPRFQERWLEHGAAAFEFRVVEECAVEHLVQREQFHLDFYLDCPERLLNYHLSASGCGGHSDATRALLSQLGTGRVFSDETKALLSEKALGRDMSGVHAALAAAREERGGVMTPAEAAARAALCGRIVSEEACANLSKALKGKPKTAEHAANISAGKMGHSTSDEAREKMSQAADDRFSDPDWKKAWYEANMKGVAKLRGRKRPPEVVAKIVATRAANKAKRLA